MPAHIDGFTRLKIFGAVLRINLDPRRAAKMHREKRLMAKTERNKRAGTPDAGNNRAEYFPMKYLTESVEFRVRGKREREFRYYDVFRDYLDELDPALPYQDGAGHTDQREWDLYLRPGTEFDGQCQLYLASGRGPLVVIVHNSDRLKPKRIEAVPYDGKPVILWTDAA